MIQNDLLADIDRLAQRWIGAADRYGISLDEAARMACKGIDESSPVAGILKATIMIEKITRMTK